MLAESSSISQKVTLAVTVTQKKLERLRSKCCKVCTVTTVSFLNFWTPLYALRYGEHPFNLAALLVSMQKKSISTRTPFRYISIQYSVIHLLHSQVARLSYWLASRNIFGFFSKTISIYDEMLNVFNRHHPPTPPHPHLIISTLNHSLGRTWTECGPCQCAVVDDTL